MVRLSKNEKQLMELLWASEVPLTCTEMVHNSKDKMWKDSYVHVMVTSLMKKGMIKVDSVELVCKIYARKFVPTMTKDEYYIRTLIDENIWTKEKMPMLLSAFVETTADLEVLEEFNRIIEQKKKELCE